MPPLLPRNHPISGDSLFTEGIGGRREEIGPAAIAERFLLLGEGCAERIPGRREDVATAVRVAWLAAFQDRLPHLDEALPLFSISPGEALARRTKELVKSDPQRMLLAVAQGLDEALSLSPRIAAGEILADLGLFVLEQASIVASAAKRSWLQDFPSVAAPRVVSAALSLAHELDAREPADREGRGHLAWRNLHNALENIQSAGNASVVAQCLRGSFSQGNPSR